MYRIEIESIICEDVFHTVTVIAILVTIRIDINYISIEDIDFSDPIALGALPSEQFDAIVVGFKLAVIIEQTQILTIWLVKACLLIQYARLTFVFKQALFTKIVSCYTALCFVVMEILFFAVWCTPIAQYWQVPVQNQQCLSYFNHLVTNAVVNISSDLLIITVPLPIIWNLPKLGRVKKLGLLLVFTLGIFTILAAVLGKYYVFTNPGTIDWYTWYIRESSTSIIVACMPCTWTLIQRMFRLGLKKISIQNAQIQNTPSQTSANRGPRLNKSEQARRDADNILPDGSRFGTNVATLQLWGSGEDEMMTCEEDLTLKQSG
ncbi:hypothetical protein BX600DRAFT_431566 [Xylariales sp. PMI_506]|nr:hypothetical protein BX600DRAFT_431566 [Xylariales sp. PMI_506]